MPTSYDIVAYPSAIFPASHPDQMAVVARMHGLDAPPVETARVLEIGGGDGYNVIGLAAAYPNARFLSFDLSSEAVRRGKLLVDKAGLDNIEVAVGDILDAARDLKQPFDYVICHGVYAWVPEIVRDAILQLIGNVLTPDGVAFISYNALPGGHLRMALREMLAREVAGIEGYEARLEAARVFLEAYSIAEDGDPPPRQALRAEAADLLQKRMHIIFHDELGEVFAPQALCDVAAAAERFGLQFLGDAGEGPAGDGFLPDGATDLSTAAVVRAAQLFDDKSVRFFRQSLFVRADRMPERRVDLSHFKSFYVSSTSLPIDETRFAWSGGEFTIDDPVLAGIMKRIVDASPDRLRLSDLTDDETVIRALFRFCEVGWASFHTVPTPYAVAPLERPKLSLLARAQMELDRDIVARLDQRVLKVAEPGPRAFMRLLDGAHTLDELRALWAADEHHTEMDFDSALKMTLKFALIERPA